MGRPIGIYASSATRRERAWRRRRRKLSRLAMLRPGAVAFLASVTAIGALVTEKLAA